MRVVSSAVFAVAVFALAGCGPGKVNEKKTLSMSKDVAARAVDLPAVSKPQTLTIKYSSSDGDVSVLVYKAADVKDDDAMSMTEGGKALAKTRGKEGTLTAEIPENTAVRVIVREAAKTPDVTLEITN